MRGKPEGFATKDTITERCILPSHSEFPGTNCPVCGVSVPRLPWTPEQFAEHGRKREAPVWNGEQTPDPADSANPKSPELIAASAAEALARAAHEAAVSDLAAIDRVLGNLFVTLATGAGGQIAPDRDEAKLEAAKQMRPQAFAAAERAADALLAARIEVQRLSRARAAAMRQWHFDNQQAAASAAKATTTRGTPFRSFLDRLGR